MNYALRGARLLPALIAATAIVAEGACSSEPEPGDGSAGSASGLGGGGGGGGSTGATVTSTAQTGVVGPVSGSGGSALPHSFEVSGVVTDGTAPLGGAIVMQAGGEPAMTTGPDGAFTIVMTQHIPGTPTVVASKVGYRTSGVEIEELPDGPIELALVFAATPDNVAYIYGDPGKGSVETDKSTKYCGHCHTTLAKQFQTSAHARATQDPLVQDLYAGVSRAAADKVACEARGGAWRVGLVPGTAGDAVEKCYLGGGVLPDLNSSCGGPAGLSCDDPGLPAAQKPKNFGRCADCHAAGMNGQAGGRSLLEATGIAYENGNHCDVCHHVKEIDLAKPPGTAGRLVLQRPIEKLSSEPGAEPLQVMFGPLPDVPLVFMGGSYQPKFNQAEFCAGCHEQKQEALLQGSALDPSRWPDGLPVHSTFSEWSEGPFNTPGTPCQFCHMPPTLGLKNSVDVTSEANASIAFGFLRPPEQLRSHIFRGPLEGAPRLIDTAAAMFLSIKVSGNELTATVTLKNTGAGHAIPTGEPLRALVLLVHAEACGAPLSAIGGATVFDIGGAAAEATVGAGVSAAGAELTWPAGALQAKAGDVVRAVRPTGMFDDYKGIGFFADPGLTPAQKGLEIRVPIGSASVVSAAGGKLSLSAPLAVKDGDIVFLGDAAAWPLADGQSSPAVAGAPGYAFARVLVDPGGARGVPHYRAMDIASDNRIAPQAEASTTHTFTTPQACAQASVTAALLYRPVPVSLARERGWDARDHIIATAKETAALP